jgi:hypothetical protein
MPGIAHVSASSDSRKSTFNATPAVTDLYGKGCTNRKGEHMKQYEIIETVDGEYAVLVDGIQWGKGPRDLSGCSSQTWPTREEAQKAIETEA